jgi:hypothetical protein
LRIAFVCYWNKLARDGVAYKVEGQVGRWRDEGHEVAVFCLTRSRGAEGLDWRLFPFDGLRGRVAATRALERATLEWAPDVVYLRYDLYLPPPFGLLGRVPGVVEVNADDREEARLVRGPAGRLYNAVSRRLLLGRASGLVFVTHELARNPSFSRFGKPAVVVANGVDLDALTPLPAPVVGARPRAVFLGTRNQPWHGVDKLVRLAGELPGMDFDVIGWNAGQLPAAAPSNLTAHGRLSRAEYEPLLAAADVAIGTLALHRKNMEEACPLKVREYLGYGLPVVLGYTDTDLGDADRWYVLRLPNEEDNAASSVAAIEAFVERVRGRRVPREEVEDLVGARAKERTRLAFFAERAHGYASSAPR